MNKCSWWLCIDCHYLLFTAEHRHLILIITLTKAVTVSANSSLAQINSLLLTCPRNQITTIHQVIIVTIILILLTINNILIISLIIIIYSVTLHNPSLSIIFIMVTSAQRKLKRICSETS